MVGFARGEVTPACKFRHAVKTEARATSRYDEVAALSQRTEANFQNTGMIPPSRSLFSRLGAALNGTASFISRPSATSVRPWLRNTWCW